MSNTMIDMDLLDINNGKNPFEEIMSKLESLSLKGTFIFNKDEVEKNILYLERKYQDYHDEDVQKSDWIAEAVQASSVFLDYDDLHVETLADKIKNITKLASVMSNQTHTDLRQYSVKQFFSNEETDNGSIQKENFLYAYQLAYNFIIDSESVDKDWTIEMNFDTTEKGKHKPLEFIHTFIEALNTIEGVEVSLDDIRIGSIKAQLNVNFKNKEAKEEFKAILSQLQNIDVSDSIPDNEIVSNDLGKIDVLNPSYEHLSKESLRLDIERKKLENDAIRLKNFADRKNTLAELLKDGIIDQRNFEILIKGIPFLSWDGSGITIGDSIDVIDKL